MLPEPVKATTAKTYNQVVDTSHSTLHSMQDRVDYWARWIGGEVHKALDRLSAGGGAPAGEKRGAGQPLPPEAKRLLFKDGIDYVARARQADRKLRKWPDSLVSMYALGLIWYLSMLDTAWWRVRQAVGGSFTFGSRLLFG